MKSSSTTIDNISPKFRIGLLEIGDVLGEPLISCFSFAFQNSNVLVDLVNVGFKRGFESPDIRGVRTKLLLDSPREYSGPHCLDQKKASLQRSEASKLSRSFLPGFGSGGVALLMVQEEIFQACRFGGGSLAAQVFPTGQHEGSANLLQSDLRIFPPAVASCAN